MFSSLPAAQAFRDLRRGADPLNKYEIFACEIEAYTDTDKGVWCLGGPSRLFSGARVVFEQLPEGTILAERVRLLHMITYSNPDSLAKVRATRDHFFPERVDL